MQCVIPGVVLRVPAMTPRKPYPTARSFVRLDLRNAVDRRNYCRRLVTTHAVAIPLHRASKFRAMRSPRSKYRALPRTVAMCFTGSNSWPSVTCHSTLQRVSYQERLTRDEVANARALQETEYFVNKWCSCKDSAVGPFAPKECLAESFADDKSAIVE